MLFKEKDDSLMSLTSPLRMPLDGHLKAAIKDNLPPFPASATKALIFEVPMSKEVMYIIFLFFHFYSITFSFMRIAK